MLREHRKVSLFHLEDLYPGWNGLAAGIERYVHTVLTSLHRGQDAQWVSWDWAAHFDGAARQTAAAEIVIVEGVGSAQAAARPMLDAMIWVDAPEPLRKERALARDGEAYAPYWDLWAAQETALLASDHPAEHAHVRANSPVTPTDVLRALTALPSLATVLAPEIHHELARETMAEQIPFSGDPKALFSTLFGQSTNRVWLDSSDAGTPTGRNRFSILADDGGPSGQLAQHTDGVTEQRFRGVTVRVPGPFFRWLDAQWSNTQWSNTQWSNTQWSATTQRPTTQWPSNQQTANQRAANQQTGRWAHGQQSHGQVRLAPPPELPFALGWIGYLGYELKRETGGSRQSANAPDASLLLAGRAVVVDHQEHCLWALSLAGDPGWADQVRDAVSASSDMTSGEKPARTPVSGIPVSARENRTEYKAKIAQAQAQIVEGNSYEICLTTQLTFNTEAAPLQLYTALRAASPAPFAAFLTFDELRVLSSSPERLLQISAGGALKAEPIKGTRRRDADPGKDSDLRAELADSAKDRAENIMIVDLMRNDLSHFAEPGSVRVSRLCDIESYATVHQLVSTVEAQLKPGVSRAEAVAAAFPAGSMTGAPKISTMQILDELEGAPRGVYSGAIGYFSRDGSCDLSVVIRTLVLEGSKASLGVGGAITADSAPEEEWQEVRTKAFGVLNALGLEFPED